MRLSKFYETDDGELVAFFFEDGKCISFIPSPEVAALDEGLIEEAKLGFPDDSFYGFNSSDDYFKDNLKMQKEDKLVAQIGEQIVLYPQRMGSYVRDVFEIELGEEVWNDVLKKVNDDAEIIVNI